MIESVSLQLQSPLPHHQSNITSHAIALHSASLSEPPKPSESGISTDNSKELDPAEGESESFKPKSRSRLGCFTCRKRKKRCDEGKPVCKACKRLKLDCHYPAPGEERKNRKRKSSFNDEIAKRPENSSTEPPKNVEDTSRPKLVKKVRKNLTKATVPESPAVSVVAASPPAKATLTATALSNGSDKPNNNIQSNPKTPLERNSATSDYITDSKKPNFYQETQSSISSLFPGSPYSNSNQIEAFSPSLETFQSLLYHKFDFGAASNPHDKSSLHNDSLIYTDTGLSPFSAASPQSSSSHSSYDSQNQDNTFQRYWGTTPQPHGRDGSNRIEKIYQDTSNALSEYVQTFHDDPEHMEKLNNIFNVSRRPHTPVEVGAPSPNYEFLKDLQNLLAPTGAEPRTRVSDLDNDNIEGLNKGQGKFDTQKEQTNMSLQKVNSPKLFDNSFLDSFGFSSNGTPNFYDANDNFFFGASPERSFSEPMLFSTPSPWYSEYLDRFGNDMFEYYNSHLAKMICVSSSDFNSFLDVFVPMAQQDPAVLYALVAYASFHQNQGKQEDNGIAYLNKAIELVQKEQPHGKKLTTLASILIIATAEICRGDMVHWDKYLETAADVIKKNGGLRNFVGDKTKRWLATNFFYHEILGASKTSSKTHFRAIEYEEILSSDSGVHTLIGCCKPIFHLMAKLSDLAVEAQELLEKFEGDEATEPDVFHAQQLRNLHEQAQQLEDQIDNCEPDPADIVSLSSKDQEDQLTLFETFQITAKIQLRQTVLHSNAANVNMQLLASELVASLDVVLHTNVEGSLVFPLFIAAIMATRRQTREAMVERLTKFYERNHARNILRARNLAQQVWELDCNGTKYVNWGKLIKEHGFDICFA